MKFTTRLKGFQDYVDLKATLTDKRGRKVIDTVTRQGDFNGRFTFRFDKSDLPGTSIIAIERHSTIMIAGMSEHGVGVRVVRAHSSHSHHALACAHSR